MSIKDNFSENADLYAKFRPTYPNELYEFINATITNKNRAWDCATGTGQIAIELSGLFKAVYATDISAAQIEQAPHVANIIYSVEQAEQSTFDDSFFDLIIVGQAIHWFDFEKFFAEVSRTLKPDGLFIITGYGLMRINKVIDTIIDSFYSTTIGPYWDNERKHIDAAYRTIPFPFATVATPSLKITRQWSFDDCVGYLNTWSAVKHFIQKNGINPIDTIKDKLQSAWKNERLTVEFPLLLKAGKCV